MNAIDYAYTDNQFYPTPQKLVEKMLSGIEWDYIQTILEPSAGKGDILKLCRNAGRRKDGN